MDYNLRSTFKSDLSLCRVWPVEPRFRGLACHVVPRFPRFRSSRSGLKSGCEPHQAHQPTTHRPRGFSPAEREARTPSPRIPSRRGSPEDPPTPLAIPVRGSTGEVLRLSNLDPTPSWMQVIVYLFSYYLYIIFQNPKSKIPK